MPWGFTLLPSRDSVSKAPTYVHMQGEANCDRNMETFLRCIDAVKGSTGGTGFSAVKLTALGRPEILVGAESLYPKELYL